MKTIKKVFGLVASGAALISFHACSAKSGSPDDTNGMFKNGGGQANGPGWDASLGGGFSGSSGNSGAAGFIFNPGNGTGGSRTGGGDACPAIKQKPEQVVVYRDASVTDTIYQSKPVALFIMQDRSGSMVTGFPPPADPNSWNNSTAAITAFVNDPRTVGVDIGLGTFPYGPNNTADCAGSDCGTPVVPIAPLPGNAQPMINAMNAQTPSSPIALTPTECGLRGMINECLTFMAQANPPEQCVAILVTDGTPTQCDTTQANLQTIVADGHTKGVTTFTLGLPGADLNALNALAQAGGTNAAIDVSGGASQFIDALNNIRQTVAITTTTQVTTSTTIATPLPCSWSIPPAPAGSTFDKDKVNVQFIPPGGAAPVDFGRVDDVGQCAQTTQDAWYYDDPNNPTKVLACPNTCSGTLHNSTGAEVDVLFGCASHFIFH